VHSPATRAGSALLARAAHMPVFAHSSHRRHPMSTHRLTPLIAIMATLLAACGAPAVTTAPAPTTVPPAEAAPVVAVAPTAVPPTHAAPTATPRPAAAVASTVDPMLVVQPTVAPTAFTPLAAWPPSAGDPPNDTTHARLRLTNCAAYGVTYDLV